jgi:hypothetical protein
MPYEFYHTSAKYEISLRKDLADIEKELHNALKENLRTSDTNDISLIDDIKIDIKGTQLSGLWINGFVAHFSFGANFSSTKFDGPAGGFVNNFIIGFGPYDYGPDTLQNGTVRHLFQISCNDTSHFWAKSRIGRFFRKNNLKFAKNYTTKGYSVKFDETYNLDKYIDNMNKGDRSQDFGLVLLPDALYKKMKAYSYAMDGFPSLTSGNFERMFYLSAVTITTVGYGDIVPISSRTRILLSIEAIWGIILIGLFLNSLASKILKGKNK